MLQFLQRLHLFSTMNRGAMSCPVSHSPPERQLPSREWSAPLSPPPSATPPPRPHSPDPLHQSANHGPFPGCPNPFQLMPFCMNRMPSSHWPGKMAAQELTAFAAAQLHEPMPMFNWGVCWRQIKSACWLQVRQSRWWKWDRTRTPLLCCAALEQKGKAPAAKVATELFSCLQYIHTRLLSTSTTTTFVHRLNTRSGIWVVE
jgi:hypothetical protein